MADGWLAAATFILLQGVNGQHIWVNPDMITNYRRPRGVESGHFPRAAECVLFTADGKYFLVAQRCEAIRDLLQEGGR